MDKWCNFLFSRLGGVPVLRPWQCIPLFTAGWRWHGFRLVRPDSLQPRRGQASLRETGNLRVSIFFWSSWKVVQWRSSQRFEYFASLETGWAKEFRIKYLGGGVLLWFWLLASELWGFSSGRSQERIGHDFQQNSLVPRRHPFWSPAWCLPFEGVRGLMVESRGPGCGGTAGADPGFWSGGPSKVLTPRGGPWTQDLLKIGFFLYFAWKLHDFKIILGARGAWAARANLSRENSM